MKENLNPKEHGLLAHIQPMMDELMKRVNTHMTFGTAYSSSYGKFSITCTLNEHDTRNFTVRYDNQIVLDIETYSSDDIPPARKIMDSATVSIDNVIDVPYVWFDSNGVSLLDFYDELYTITPASTADEQFYLDMEYAVDVQNYNSLRFMYVSSYIKNIVFHNELLLNKFNLFGLLLEVFDHVQEQRKLMKEAT